MTDNNIDDGMMDFEMGWDFDESEEPTEEELRLSMKEDIDPEQIDLSAPQGVNIEDPIQAYLKEIERTPILSEEEEAELGRRMAEGDEEAKNKMSQANLRLVVGIARQYANQGVAFQDLIQEGNLGLLTAIDKFDDQKGFRFRTYANWWIKQAVTQAIEEQTQSAQISAHLVNEMNRQQQVSEQLTRDLGRTPTVEEIANRMGVSVDTVQEIMKISQDVQDLSKSDDEEEEDQSEEANPEEEQPEVEVVGNEKSELEEDMKEETPLKEQMEEALTSLTEQEQEVVRMRYGLDHEMPRTPDEVGKKLGLSEDEVQEIEASAMKKLQSQNQSGGFQGYVDED